MRAGPLRRKKIPEMLKMRASKKDPPNVKNVSAEKEGRRGKVETLPDLDPRNVKKVKKFRHL